MWSPTFVVVSGSTPDGPWPAILEYTHRIHKRWAERHGGLAVALDLSDWKTDRAASWHKLLALDLVCGRPTLWFDADAIPAPGSRPEDFLADAGQFRMAHDHNGVNCGAMAFGVEWKVAWVGEFLRTWWDAATPAELLHPWWEQRTMGRIIHEENVAARRGPWIAEGSVVHAAGVKNVDKLAWLRARN